MCFNWNCAMSAFWCTLQTNAFIENMIKKHSKNTEIEMNKDALDDPNVEKLQEIKQFVSQQE